MTRRACSLLLLSLALGGCGAGRARVQYLRTLDDYTEESRIYRGFSTALILRATYLAPGFRRAMSAERLRLLGPAASDPAAFLARMEDEAEAAWEIVLAAEAPLDHGNVARFGEDDGGWRIQLVAGGVEQPLISVYRVRKPNPLQEALFAHLNPWNELYIARFARTVDRPAELQLHVGSGYGHDTLTWTGDALE